MKEKMGPEHFIRIIDHTYLKTESEGHSLREQEVQIRLLIQEAQEGPAFGICVREKQVKLARSILDELKGPVKLVSVIGFPCGDDFTTQEKLDLLSFARDNGATEFDMVFNYKQFLSGASDKVFRDLLALSKAAGNSVLKVIFENGLLPSAEKKEEAYLLAKKAFLMAGGCRFFKTSTGFVKGGASLVDIALMRKVAGDEIGLKPSGGISDYETALKFFEAAGCPLIQNNMKKSYIDPYKFRIGSSTLLEKLKQLKKSS